LAGDNEYVILANLVQKTLPTNLFVILDSNLNPIVDRAGIYKTIASNVLGLAQLAESEQIKGNLYKFGPWRVTYTGSTLIWLDDISGAYFTNASTLSNAAGTVIYYKDGTSYVMQDCDTITFLPGTWVGQEIDFPDPCDGSSSSSSSSDSSDCSRSRSRSPSRRSCSPSRRSCSPSRRSRSPRRLLNNDPPSAHPTTAHHHGQPTLPNRVPGRTSFLYFLSGATLNTMNSQPTTSPLDNSNFRGMQLSLGAKVTDNLNLNNFFTLRKRGIWLGEIFPVTDINVYNVTFSTVGPPPFTSGSFRFNSLFTFHYDHTQIILTVENVGGNYTLYTNNTPSQQGLFLNGQDFTSSQPTPPVGPHPVTHHHHHFDTTGIYVVNGIPDPV